MKTQLILSSAFLFALTSCALANQAKPVVLKGLDPVALAGGKELKGDPSLFADSGRFRYLFANKEDRATFLAATKNYTVQLDGNCAMMQDMPGDPDMYVVYSNKIFLAGSTSCFSSIKSAPASYLAHFVGEAPPAHQEPARKKVAIMVFPGVQIIDFTGPYEVFGQAGYEVFTVAALPGPVTTSMNLTIEPKYTFANCPKPDIIVVPGGNVPQQAKSDDAQVNWVKEISPKASYTMSVCNGAFWLANAGILDGKMATTFYGMLDDLRKKYPKVEVVDDRKYADNGSVVCTAGLSSGIEGALHMVEKIDGLGKAKSISMNMEYNWQPDKPYARGGFADKYFRRALAGGINVPDGAATKMLDVRADRDSFEKSWEITNSKLDSTALNSFVKEQFAKVWKEEAGASNNAGSSTWSFTGDDKATWWAVVTIQADKSQTDKFVLTLRIDKNRN